MSYSLPVFDGSYEKITPASSVPPLFVMPYNTPLDSTSDPYGYDPVVSSNS